MVITVRACTPNDYDAVRALAREDGVAEHFEHLQGAVGLDRLLGDPHLPAGALWIAFAGDEPAGFAFEFLLEQAERPHAAIRIAVSPRSRRRGVGRELLDAAEAFAASQSVLPGVRDIGSSAWLPNPAAEAFAASAGFAYERTYWLMTRPRGDVAEPLWPAGVTLRPFDGSDEMLEAGSAAYNSSFAEHFRYIPVTVDGLRQMVARPGFRADGYGLAFRDGRCVGYCRNELLEMRGEIGLIGTTPDARGIGLGRALLRWGVDWLQRASTGPITLLVDGENENALRLYRSEGFEVTRTRRSWVRALESR